jgi:beta-glucanase (GH16 family)
MKKHIKLLVAAIVFVSLQMSAQPFYDPCNYKTEIPANWKQCVMDPWPSFIPGVAPASNLLMDNPNGKIYFAGTDGKVYNYYWDNDHAWQMQPLMTNQPVNINAAGGLYKDQNGKVYAIGVDGKAYNFYWLNNAWHEDALQTAQYTLLNPVGGLLVTPQGDKVYAIGTDGKVYNYYWLGSSWGFNWLNQNQYTLMNAQGGLAMDQTGKIFGIGVDGKVYNFYWTGSSWGFNWLNPNQYATIDARGKLLIDPSGKVFAIGTDGKVYNYYWTGSSWAFNWLDPNQYANMDARGGMVMDASGKIFAIGTDGKVYNYYWTGSSWAFNWLNPNQYATIDPVGGMRVDVNGKIYAIGTDGKVYNYYWQNNAWQFQRLYFNQSLTVRSSNMLAVDKQVYAVLNNGQITTFYYADATLNYCDWNLVFANEFGKGTTIPMVANDWYMNGYPWGHTNNLGFQWEYNDASAISVGAGNLHITANNTPVWGNVADYLPPNQLMSDGNPNYRQFNFTSGCIYSKASYLYGLFEIRCKQPPGKGFWPAFWMIGASSWPPEVDIFEGLGAQPLYSSNNNIWRVDANTTDHCSMYYNTTTTPDFTSDYHTYSFAWFSDHITFYLDGNELRTVYHHIPQVPMIMLANLAVGIDYPDASTPFPSKFDIDYIRVYSYGPHCREASPLAEAGDASAGMSFSIYPNPANNLVNICSVNEMQHIDKIELYNLEGEKVQEEEVTDGSCSHPVDLSGLPAGVYVLRIYSGATVQSQKIIRQ